MNRDRNQTLAELVVDRLLKQKTKHATKKNMKLSARETYIHLLRCTVVCIIG